ncbi:MAG: RluA family pseudouridine synthase [Proteobacteria bacterium]|nr:RluA family pseudouridine synthase [Pseudomonadota bacterium]
MPQFTITEPGERLDLFVAAHSPQWSRSQIKRAIDDMQILVNQIPCTKAGQKLRVGDCVSWDIPEAVDIDHPQPETGIDFKVLYEDPHLIIIDKPAGLVVHPGAGHLSGTLVNGILSLYPEIAEIGESARPGIVHRIDAETSGLLLIARSQASYEKLVQMFSVHDIHRQYWAICHAPKLPDYGRFDTPYGRHPTQRVKYSSRFEAEKRAITDYRVAARNEQGFALVTCKLQTGRTHQVRVHLSDHHAPILGDPLYAPPQIAHTKIIQRLALHAQKLVFEHPVTREHCEFESPFPDDFRCAIQKLHLDANVPQPASNP